MRRNRLLLGAVLSVLLCASLILSAKADATSWVQTYGQSDSGQAFSLITTSDGGYAMVGVTDFYDTSVDCWLVKTDVAGNEQWNKTYGGTGNECGYSLVNASDGGYAMAGVWNCSIEDLVEKYYHPNNIIDGDFWLVKTDAYGNMEWNKTYGGTEGDLAYSLIATSDGGYALAGYTRSFGAGLWDGWLVKTDAYGNMEWNKTYGGTRNDVVCSVVETGDGGYAMAGFTYSFDAIELDGWLVKTDASGNAEWNQTYGGASWDYAYSLVETSDGGYALAGTYYNYSGFNGQDDGWLVKTDAYGNMEWSKVYGGVGYDGAYSLVETSDGGYALAGTSMSFGVGYPCDFWLVKTDAYGNMEWNMTYGDEGPDYAYSLVETSDGGYAIAGTYAYLPWWVPVAHYDFWLVKTDENGFAPVAPEAAWVILPFLLAATVSIFICKKRLLHKRS